MAKESYKDWAIPWSKGKAEIPYTSWVNPSKGPKRAS